ncbi:Crp/Fnr family transcriptional regulator [Gynurincola endophyticus]|uniref:Crp/Fnr family transcriptional regulator n=1 Tax=Gynurincola endophyticus TaxID=2479004 RepID=UPI000F8E2A61|nr:Crp/Fnr family transcriptional regulator [Gynurincola endophyticus]
MYILLETFIDKISSISEEEHYHLHKICEVRSYGRYEKLNIEDQYEEYLHFITKGVIRKFCKKDEEDITIQLAQEGEIICADVTVFSDQPTRYQLETLEPTTTLSISKKRFLELYDKHPGIQRLSRKLLTLMLLKSEEYELEQVKYALRDRMARFLESQPQLINRVPQKILASYLNIQPETFSRLKTSLSAHKQNFEVNNNHPVI